MKFAHFSLFSVLVIFSACGQKEVTVSEVPLVRLTQVKQVAASEHTSYPAQTRAINTSNVAFRVSGTLANVKVKEGDYVREGQVIAVMDDRDYQVQLSATEAEYAQIKADCERVIALYNDGSTTAQNYDKARYGLQQITEVENPNSVQQMKEWLRDNGLEIESLGKKEVAAVLKTAPPEIAEVLTLRQMLSKSSVRKYRAMQNAVCQDGRARGMFQFYGANRSGRFCLAEGTQVLIKDKNNAIYEKNIEDVAINDLVFDGEKWVHHEGVVFSGDKDVITWDGITATPCHKVFIDANTTITLLEAKERGLKIWQGNKSNIPSIE